MCPAPMCSTASTAAGATRSTCSACRLNEAANRDAFRADPEGYLDGHALTAEQRRAVLERDWVGMLRLGGNIYYTFKLAASSTA